MRSPRVPEAASWVGQAARPLRGSMRSPGVLSFHGLMWPASSIRRRRMPRGSGRKDAPAAAVGQHMRGEHVLADPGRCQRLAGAPEDLICAGRVAGTEPAVGIQAGLRATGPRRRAATLRDQLSNGHHRG